MSETKVDRAVDTLWTEIEPLIAGFPGDSVAKRAIASALIVRLTKFVINEGELFPTPKTEGAANE